MKLNNHGWGLKDMIIYTCIILFFLFLASYFIGILYKDINDNYYNEDQNKQQNVDVQEKIDSKEEIKIDYDYYYNKEIIFKNAVYTYLVNNNYNLSTEIFNIRLSDLVSFGYLDPIYDFIDNSKCDGYANVIGQETNYEVYAYLYCRNYISEGYYR